MKELPDQLSYALFAASGSGLPAGRVFTTSVAEALAPAAVPVAVLEPPGRDLEPDDVKVYVDGTQMSSEPAAGPLAAATGPCGSAATGSSASSSAG